MIKRTGAFKIYPRLPNIFSSNVKDLDILTVGIVTIPFHFEGTMRNEQAQIGVDGNLDATIPIIIFQCNAIFFIIIYLFYF